MAEQESIQTQLDCLRFDVVKLQQRELARDRDILELVHRQKTLGTCMLGLTHHIEVCQKELHLLRDTVASLQQDVATLENMVGNHINESTFDGDMGVRLETLENKLELWEEVTNVTVSLDETDEGGAERAEMERAEYERQQAHFSFGELKLIQGECVQCERVCMITPVGGYCEGCYYDNINAV